MGLYWMCPIFLSTLKCLLWFSQGDAICASCQRFHSTFVSSTQHVQVCDCSLQFLGMEAGRGDESELVTLNDGALWTSQCNTTFTMLQ